MKIENIPKTRIVSSIIKAKAIQFDSDDGTVRLVWYNRAAAESIEKV